MTSIFSRYLLTGLLLTLSLSIGQASPPRQASHNVIVYSVLRDGNRDIYTYDLNTGIETRLTRNPAEDRNPAWSPDYSQILFTSNRGRGFGIWLMNADGSDQQAIIDDGDYYEHPAWSPTGRQITYAANERGNLDIYVSASNGLYEVQLTIDDSDDTAPSWSANGRRILFTSARDNRSGVYAYDLASNRIDGLITDVGADFLAPTWVYPGTDVITGRYTFAADSAVGGILYVGAEGELTQFARHPDYTIGEITLLPDSSIILYTIFDLFNPMDGHEVWQVSLDNSNPRQLFDRTQGIEGLNAIAPNTTDQQLGEVWGHIYRANGEQVTRGPLALCIDMDCHTQTLESPWYYRADVPTGTVSIRIRWPNNNSGTYITCGRGNIVRGESTQVDCHIPFD
jgi:hypothetical protein